MSVSLSLGDARCTQMAAMHGTREATKHVHGEKYSMFCLAMIAQNETKLNNFITKSMDY